MPSARQFDGIVTSTVAGDVGLGCTVPGGASGTSCALAMTTVEPGIFQPVNSTHFSLGIVFGGLSPAVCAVAEVTATIGTAPEARQTIIRVIAAHVFNFIPPSRLFLVVHDARIPG